MNVPAWSETRLIQDAMYSMNAQHCPRTMADTQAVTQSRTCESPGCNNLASLQCPTCIKLKISGSFFCSQECFKKNWNTHKVLHKKNENGLSDNKIGQNHSLEKDTSPCNGYNPWPGYIFSGPLRPFPKSVKHEVPEHIMRPDYANHPDGYPTSEMAVKSSTQIRSLSAEEIEGMRVVCKLAREVLDIAAMAVKAGVTTDEIDSIVHKATIERNCYPSPLNYHGFPKSCCTSLNEVICHGIPDHRPLRDGDILNIDITCFYNGFHGDLNETFLVGEVDEESTKLVQTAYECLMLAVNEVKPGMRYRDLGDVIQKHAKANNCSVTKSYCGHGIHRLFHTAPNVPHYARNKAVGVMKPGHVFTIEPMINKGTWKDQLWPDDWTVVTQDGLRSAQFEHTLLVTETGVDILTERPERNGKPHFLDQL